MPPEKTPSEKIGKEFSFNATIARKFESQDYLEGFNLVHANRDFARISYERLSDDEQYQFLVVPWHVAPEAEAISFDPTAGWIEALYQHILPEVRAAGDIEKKLAAFLQALLLDFPMLPGQDQEFAEYVTTLDELTKSYSKKPAAKQLFICSEPDSKQKVFTLEESQVADLSLREKMQPIIPVEYYLDTINVCRHRAIVVAMLLGRLVQSGLLAGSVYNVTRRLPHREGDVAHTWSILVTKDSVFTVDLMWHCVFNLRKLDQLREAQKLYSALNIGDIMTEKSPELCKYQMAVAINHITALMIAKMNYWQITQGPPIIRPAYYPPRFSLTVVDLQSTDEKEQIMPESSHRPSSP